MNRDSAYGSSIRNDDQENYGRRKQHAVLRPVEEYGYPARQPFPGKPEEGTPNRWKQDLNENYNRELAGYSQKYSQAAYHPFRSEPISGLLPVQGTTTDRAAYIAPSYLDHGLEQEHMFDGRSRHDLGVRFAERAHLDTPQKMGDYPRPREIDHSFQSPGEMKDLTIHIAQVC